MRFRSVFLVCGALVAAAAAAAEFPEGVKTPTAREVQELFSDKNYQATLPNGNVWRVDYKANGYLFFHGGGGYTDSGKWRAEDGRMCFDLSRTGSGCNELRIAEEGVFYVRRANGDVLKYVRR